MVNPLDGQLFYVGKGHDRRYKRHVSMAKSNHTDTAKNPHLYRKIKSILAAGYNDIGYEFLATEMEEIEAYALEAAYIEYYGNTLCNICKGGISDTSHLVGRKLPEDILKRISFRTKRKMKEVMKRPENVFLMRWSSALLQFHNAIKTHGSWAAYQQYKKDKELASHRASELRQNLKLLGSVIYDIRVELLKAKYHEFITVK
jgi:hypothetical protein